MEGVFFTYVHNQYINLVPGLISQVGITLRLTLGVIVLGNLLKNVMSSLLSAAVFQAQMYYFFTYDGAVLFPILISQKKRHLFYPVKKVHSLPVFQSPCAFCLSCPY